jgi:hypothetical protein
VRHWKPAVPDALAEKAVATAIDVANRLRDREVRGVQSGLEASAGVAVLYGQLDRLWPDDGWDRAAHAALAIATEDLNGAWSTHPGLFGGLGGAAFTAFWLSRDGSRYQRLMSTLDGRIVAEATERGAALAAGPYGLPARAFDVIVGLAGTAGYLLLRAEDQALRSVLTGLVRLCQDGPDGPNWFTPAEAMFPDSPIAQQFPEGVFNCGLAHGIPGPVAALSLASQAGISVAGQGAAIAYASQWLVENRVDDEWGPNWSFGVSPQGRPGHPAQSAWCYGSPGVARSLWLAGTALDDPKLRELAVEAMAAVYRRPWSVRAIGQSPGLCHGVGGLLQITLRFAHDTGEPVFTDAATDLTERLLALYEPDRAVGFASIEDAGVRTDRPGLLDGAAGAALALLAAGGAAEPRWDRVLLLE